MDSIPSPSNSNSPPPQINNPLIQSIQTLTSTLIPLDSSKVEEPEKHFTRSTHNQSQPQLQSDVSNNSINSNSINNSSKFSILDHFNQSNSIPTNPTTTTRTKPNSTRVKKVDRVSHSHIPPTPSSASDSDSDSRSSSPDYTKLPSFINPEDYIESDNPDSSSDDEEGTYWNKPAKKDTFARDGRVRPRPDYYYDCNFDPGNGNNGNLKRKGRRGGFKGIPVFKPTEEDFLGKEGVVGGGFYDYVKRIEKYGMRSGVVKIIPPQSWINSLPSVSEPLNQIRLREPISQHMIGSQGIYRVTNVAKTRIWNAAQWKNMAEESKWISPDFKAESELIDRSERSTKSSATTSNSNAGNVGPTSRRDKGKGKEKKVEAVDEVEDEEMIDQEREELIESVEEKVVESGIEKVEVANDVTGGEILEGQIAMEVEVEKVESSIPVSEEPEPGKSNSTPIKKRARSTSTSVPVPAFTPRQSLRNSSTSFPTPSSVNSSTSTSKLSQAPPKKKLKKLSNIQKAEPTLEEWQTFMKTFDELPHGMKVEDYTIDLMREVERRYWRTLTFGEPPMYGADMAGSLFEDSTVPWNVAHLGDLLPKLAPSSCKIPGVVSPYLYFGMWRATFAWHVEDADLYSINFIHFGAPKFWYAVPQELSGKFERGMEGLFPTDRTNCPQFLRHKSFLASPRVLANSGIILNRVIQLPGEFILTYPKGYHSGFNLGFNCAESINFATEQWLPLGRVAKSCVCIGDSVNINVDAWLHNAAVDEEEIQLKDPNSALSISRALELQAAKALEKEEQEKNRLLEVDRLLELTKAKSIAKAQSQAQARVNNSFAVASGSGVNENSMQVDYQELSTTSTTAIVKKARKPRKSKLNPEVEVEVFIKEPKLGKKALKAQLLLQQDQQVTGTSSGEVGPDLLERLGMVEEKNGKKGKKTKKSEKIQFVCALCPDMNEEGLVAIGEPGGESKKGLKAHRVCVMFTPATWIENDPENDKEIVRGFGQIEKARWSLKCQICSEKHGTKVQCTKPKCSKAYHVTCALLQDSGAMVDAKVASVSILEQARNENLDSSNESKVAIPQRALVEVEGGLSESSGTALGDEKTDGLETVVGLVEGEEEDDGSIKLTMLCKMHNPEWIKLENARKVSELKERVDEISIGSRIRAKISGSIFDITLVASIVEKESISFMFDNGKPGETKWRSIIWPESAEVLKKKEEAVAKRGESVYVYDEVRPGSQINNYNNSNSKRIPSSSVFIEAPTTSRSNVGPFTPKPLPLAKASTQVVQQPIIAPPPPTSSSQHYSAPRLPFPQQVNPQQSQHQQTSYQISQSARPQYQYSGPPPVQNSQPQSNPQLQNQYQQHYQSQQMPQQQRPSQQQQHYSQQQQQHQQQQAMQNPYLGPPPNYQYQQHSIQSQSTNQPWPHMLPQQQSSSFDYSRSQPQPPPQQYQQQGYNNNYLSNQVNYQQQNNSNPPPPLPLPSSISNDSSSYQRRYSALPFDGGESSSSNNNSNSQRRYSVLSFDGGDPVPVRRNLGQAPFPQLNSEVRTYQEYERNRMSVGSEPPFTR